MVTADLQALVEKRGLFYPPDPASLKQSTLGGNVSTGAGGPRCLKYGTTREYVRGVRAVLPGGGIISDGGKYLKSATGYNLSQLFVGSEGTLGGDHADHPAPAAAAARRWHRAGPVPEAGGRSGDGHGASSARGILPSVIEFIDRSCIRCIEQASKLGLPEDIDALILIECDGQQVAVDADLERIIALCREGGARSVDRATTTEERDKLWKARRSVSPSLSQLRPSKLGEDISLPRRAIVPMVKRLREISEEYGVLLPTFGHIGDGNLHPNLVFDPRDPEEVARIEKAAEALIKSAVGFGGTLSGEHGIGLLKKGYLPLALPEQNLVLYRQIKAVFDPHGIMNPGKVF